MQARCTWKNLTLGRILRNALPKYGYRLKMTKGSYMLGKCESARVAQQRVDHLVSLGFDRNIIKVHPDNVVAGGLRLAAARKYGTKMLGGLLGTDVFIRAELIEYGKDLAEIAKSLVEYPDLQGRLLLMRYCFMTKPNHLMRTVRPSLMEEFVQDFEELQKNILRSILKSEVNEDLFNKVCLGISQGGLGIHKSSEIVPSAYTASMIAFLRAMGWNNSLQDLQHQDLEDLPPRLQELVESVSVFKVAEDGDFVEGNFLENIQAINNLKVEKKQTLQGKLNHILSSRRLANMENQMLSQLTTSYGQLTMLSSWNSTKS